MIETFLIILIVAVVILGVCILEQLVNIKTLLVKTIESVVSIESTISHVTIIEDN